MCARCEAGAVLPVIVIVPKGDCGMGVPDYQSVMLPLLQLAAARGGEISTAEAVDALAQEFDLTEQDLRELLPSGIQPRFLNRVGWAATYMKKAGLLEATRRAHFRITPRGQELLKKSPPTINVKLLQQYPEFVEFQQLKGTRRGKTSTEGTDETSGVTPSEALEAAYEDLRDALADELLARLKKSSPSFFERLVVDLLVKMGYGGSRADAGKAVGKTGSLKKTGLDWMRFTSRQSAGRTTRFEARM
jgi:restriction system protein